ncbi:nuclear transport factor 2 family protein [Tamlana fucoidanivorans]|uniref:Nuclear transport factor 2 family protein n=1 Tax=Allotamlana fucoidanivorans TaxID=2583814 RepID=A0A5C4SLG5_9FLAO|nr:nuclear transport factor 2 family protein [Tamlana fucoidanivorans]TNJ44250.1 nuclear transport factor 2 family protein [Tamlana fucoidanivorans]
MFNTHIKDIEKLISNYFEGIYHGNISQLASCFQKDTLIFGDINGTEYSKNSKEYLKGVENRQSPNELNESFQMKILGIEILGNIAMVKLHVPMLGFNYYDYLSLTKIDGHWKIVSKIFTHVNH